MDEVVVVARIVRLVRSRSMLLVVESDWHICRAMHRKYLAGPRIHAQDFVDCNIWSTRQVVVGSGFCDARGTAAAKEARNIQTRLA